MPIFSRIASGSIFLSESLKIIIFSLEESLVPIFPWIASCSNFFHKNLWFIFFLGGILNFIYFFSSDFHHAYTR